MKCPIKKLESDCIEKECPFYERSGCSLASVAKSINQLEDQLDLLGDKIDGLAETIYENAKKQLDHFGPIVSKCERSRKRVAAKFGVGEGTIAEITKMEPEEKKKTVESILSSEPKKTLTKRVGFTKEARQVKQDIADIVADMYDSDSDYEYGVSDLVDEIKVNTEAFIKMLRRTADMRLDVISGNEENKQQVISTINEYAIGEINRIVEVIKNA